MTIKFIRVSASAYLAAGLCLFAFSAHAQGFDPSKVDWEALSKIPMQDSFIKQFNQDCAVCHGEDLRGAALGTPLVGIKLRHGESVAEIAQSIAQGFPDKGMPAWSETLDKNRIWNLALYVAEQRQGTTILDKRADIPLEIPTDTITTERHSFRIVTVAENLDPMPFSIAPLPKGGFLLSERMQGLSLIDTDGSQTRIKGAPRAYDDAGEFLGQVQGIGWMLGVALHPDYEDNGWIYIHHTDRCSDCNELSRKSGRPVSMNRLVRGRIKDHQWIDEQVIWQAASETYTDTSDLAAGGRISFDKNRHVYISIGMKGVLDILGTQDLDLPYGKILRLNDDGSIPTDNPFIDQDDTLPALWTYGHRSVQGLAFNAQTGEHWSTEMGPRGGDELNRLTPGGNYGWPVFTSGVNYDGRPVKVPKNINADLARDDVEFPVLDLTPSPAISNLIFYSGSQFPDWENNILVGTLRATDLWRLELRGNEVAHKEVLLEDLARFRDIKQGPNGELYILLEHASGGKIIRLDPVGVTD